MSNGRPLRRLLRNRRERIFKTIKTRSESVFDKFEGLRDRKKEEWKAKGYSDKIIDKAFTWAQEYTISMSSKVTENSKLREAIQSELYPKSLEMAEIWMEKVTKYIQGGKKREV